MADFTLSNWAKAQARLDDMFEAPEMKVKQAAAMNIFLDKRDISIEGLRGLRYREDRPQEAYFRTRQNRNVTGGARNFQHTGVHGDTAKIDLVWDTFLDTFSISMKRQDNNLYTFEETLAYELQQVFLNFYEGVETEALGYLDTNKTQVNIATKLGNFNAANGAWEVATANIDDYFRNSQSMMRQNYYSSGVYNLVADPCITALGMKQFAQGQANATNLGYQFPGLNIVESTELADANYPTGLAYWIAPMNIAVLDWIPKQNREGFGNLENATKDNPYFTSIQDPFFGLSWAVHIYKEGADTTGTNGNAQDVVWQYEVSLDLSFNHAPLSVAGETPILAAAII